MSSSTVLSIATDLTPMNATQVPNFTDVDISDMTSVNLNTRNVIIGVVGVSLNVLSAVFLSLSKHIRTAIKIALLSQTASDILFMISMTAVGFQQKHWETEHPLCWTVIILACLSLVMSYGNTCILAIHNFIAVFYPLISSIIMSSTRSALAVACLWVLNTVICVAVVGVYPQRGSQCYPSSVVSRAGILTQSILCILYSVSVIVINLKIFIRVRARQKVVHPLPVASTSTNRKTTEPTLTTPDMKRKSTPNAFGITCIPSSKTMKKTMVRTDGKSMPTEFDKSKLVHLSKAQPAASFIATECKPTNPKVFASTFTDNSLSPLNARLLHEDAKSIGSSRRFESEDRNLDMSRNSPAKMTLVSGMRLFISNVNMDSHDYYSGASGVSTAESSSCNISRLPKDNLAKNESCRHVQNDKPGLLSIPSTSHFMVRKKLGKNLDEDGQNRSYGCKSGKSKGKVAKIGNELYSQSSANVEDSQKCCVQERQWKADQSHRNESDSREILKHRDSESQGEQTNETLPMPRNERLGSGDFQIGTNRQGETTSHTSEEIDTGGSGVYIRRHVGSRETRLRNTLMILSMWCCLITIPLIFYWLYASVVLDDDEPIYDSGVGAVFSSLLMVNALSNPFVYGWRFIKWKQLYSRLKARLTGRY